MSRHPRELRDVLDRLADAAAKLQRLRIELAELDAPAASPALHRAAGRIAQGLRELEAAKERL